MTDMNEIPNFPNLEQAAKYVQDLESKTRLIIQASSNKEIRESALAAYRLVDIAIGNNEDRDDDMKAYAEGIHYTMAIIIDTRSSLDSSNESNQMIFLYFLQNILSTVLFRKPKNVEFLKKYCRDTIDFFWPEENQ